MWHVFPLILRDFPLEISINRLMWPIYGAVREGRLAQEEREVFVSESVHGGREGEEGEEDVLLDVDPDILSTVVSSVCVCVCCWLFS